MGNRIAKHVYNNGTGLLENSTYYILDAQGQQISMYEHNVGSETVSYYLAERNIYGSYYLGVTRDTINMYAPDLLPSYGVLGNRNYELSNHLGNVLAVINDVKTPLDENSDTYVDGYKIGILSISDYSPFGVQLDGRTMSSLEYRYGFNGKEKDDEVKGEGNSYDYGFRMYDSRAVKFYSIDPLTKNYPWYTPYQFAGNNPIWAIDLDGEEEKIIHEDLKNNIGFTMMMNIASNTTLGAEFDKVLKSQNQMDVYYYPFDSKESSGSGLISEGVTYNNGYAEGFMGQTNVVKNSKELEEFHLKNYVGQFINPLDINKSLNQGKSVILIGIAKQVVTPFANPFSVFLNNWTINKLMNLTVSGTETIVHEESSHAQNILKGIEKTVYQQHQDYHGKYTYSSPSITNLINNKDFSNTNAGKTVKEIIEIIHDYSKLLNKK